MVNSEGREIAAVYGAVPAWAGPFQVARDGEDFAFWAMVHCAHDVDAVFTDCLGSVQCAHDRQKATSAANPRAHLWKRYWEVLGPATLVHKTMAHSTVAQVHEGQTTMWEHLGNKAADARARQGAALHPWSDRAQALLDDAWGEALEVAAWAGWQEAASCLPPDAVEDISIEEQALRRQATAARRQAAGSLEVDSPGDKSVAPAARHLAERLR